MVEIQVRILSFDFLKFQKATQFFFVEGVFLVLSGRIAFKGPATSGVNQAGPSKCLGTGLRYRPARPVQLAHSFFYNKCCLTVVFSFLYRGPRVDALSKGTK